MEKENFEEAIPKPSLDELKKRRSQIEYAYKFGSDHEYSLATNGGDKRDHSEILQELDDWIKELEEKDKTT